jgi:hypothetical protein
MLIKFEIFPMLHHVMSSNDGGTLYPPERGYVCPKQQTFSKVCPFSRNVKDLFVCFCLQKYEYYANKLFAIHIFLQD